MKALVSAITETARVARRRSAPRPTGMTPLSENDQVVRKTKTSCGKPQQEEQGLGGRGAEGRNTKRWTVDHRCVERLGVAQRPSLNCHQEHRTSGRQHRHRVCRALGCEHRSERSYTVKIAVVERARVLEW